jgi:hypothetical protein
MTEERIMNRMIYHDYNSPIDAYREGCIDRLAGKLKIDNPYPYNQVTWHSWNQGWIDEDLAYQDYIHEDMIKIVRRYHEGEE